MTSPDGITWTTRTSSAEDNQWKSVCWGNGQFVAVGSNSPGVGTHRVMTSPDGITWTARSTPTNPLNPTAQLTWISVVWNGTNYVAVANGDDNAASVLNSVMTSPDGITWTIRSAASADSWSCIAWNGSVLAAVSQTGKVMTSPDGITWTSRTAAAANQWYGLAWGNGVFVATSIDGVSNRVMTSPDGITWTSRATPNYGNWYQVAYGNGQFIAVSQDIANPQSMFSNDNGATWSFRSAAAANTWMGVTYGNGLFVAVGESGVGNRVMTSPGF